ncbi:MAG: SNF2-related protein [Thermoanaerobaculia bacterium]
MTAETIVDRIAVIVRGHLPAGISPAYLDGFLARNRSALVDAVARSLEEQTRRRDTDLWSGADRTRANLAAMQIVADKAPADMTDADRRIVAGYSGWGGLSIAAADRFPPGFPAPEVRGLIHEYYTPSNVAREVARVVRPLIPDLPKADGVVLALEPSAGIGRFVQAASGPGFEDLQGLVVEWSELSARMLRALRSDLPVYYGPFERWVREQGPEYAGRIGLVLANPPYGARGASVTEDPDRAYREKAAYAYFLRRGLDLLAPNGLGVYLVPGGFLTGSGTATVGLRSKVLRRHHLSAAFRLPSRLFPGAELVTDLLFFRARGGELPEVDPSDQAILEGRYFREFPEHVLGTEVGRDAGDDDQTKKPRWGYQVQGTFDRLPDLVERPMCTTCTFTIIDAPKARARPGIARRLEAATEGLPEPVASAVALGLRVDRYLAALSAQTSDEHVQLWPELHEALLAWTRKHGNPRTSADLNALVAQGNVGAERFLQAFTRGGALIAGLATRPTWEPRYTGRPADAVALAEWVYRTRRKVTLADLGGSRAPVDDLVAAGWCLDGEKWDDLVPERDYYVGNLWPKHDRAVAREFGTVAQAQARRLLEVIQPAVLEDIQGVSPRQGWVPLQLVAAWMSEALNRHYGAVQLERREGLVQIVGLDYDRIDGARELAAETRWCIGWLNHDKSTFKPRKRKDENLDEVRLKLAAEWDRAFRAWVASDADRTAKVEEAYNRHFKGYITPVWDAEPLPIARWASDGVQLHPHQVAGARRVLANRGGLVAFDVGVGKTYTGIAVLARARQEGWCRRPVVLVPNSIVWKWKADVERVLPDYRVAVVGSKHKVVARGARKGLVTSETDTPAERAEKWTRFQAGEFDVVLLTYTALARTRMNEAAIRAYADQTEAIRREVRLRQRNASQTKKLTERQQAILKEGVAAWIAEQMELPEGWAYDPGVAWDDIGVDLLLVDEGQNFKNLHLPEAREGGVPRFMGNAGEGSKRAWQLDFRCAAVRRRTGGSGIVLLSATPAKNSPLEFYNLVQYVDHDAWARMGIRDPEQFIDRYLRIELKPVVDSKMDVVERSAVTGFQNLHELREVLFRYGEFKTADDVGLKLPEPRSPGRRGRPERRAGGQVRGVRRADRGRAGVDPDLGQGEDPRVARADGAGGRSPAARRGVRLEDRGDVRGRADFTEVRGPGEAGDREPDLRAHRVRRQRRGAPVGRGDAGARRGPRGPDRGAQRPDSTGSGRPAAGRTRVQRGPGGGGRAEVRRRSRERDRLRGHRPADADLRHPPPRPAVGAGDAAAAQRARGAAGQHAPDHRDRVLLRAAQPGRAPVQPDPGQARLDDAAAAVPGAGHQQPRRAAGARAGGGPAAGEPGPGQDGEAAGRRAGAAGGGGAEEGRRGRGAHAAGRECAVPEGRADGGPGGGGAAAARGRGAAQGPGAGGPGGVAVGAVDVHSARHRGAGAARRGGAGVRGAADRGPEPVGPGQAAVRRVRAGEGGVDRGA